MRRKWPTLGILLSVLWFSTVFADGHVTVIDAKTAKDMLDRNVTFIDVRSKLSFGLGHIPGAINIDVRDVDFGEAVSAVVQKDQEFVIYCRGTHCSRSPEAILILTPMGFERIFYFKEGTPGWTAAGFELEK